MPFSSLAMFNRVGLCKMPLNIRLSCKIGICEGIVSYKSVWTKVLPILLLLHVVQVDCRQPNLHHQYSLKTDISGHVLRNHQLSNLVYQLGVDIAKVGAALQSFQDV